MQKKFFKLAVATFLCMPLYAAVASQPQSKDQQTPSKAQQKKKMRRLPLDQGKLNAYVDAFYGALKNKLAGQKIPLSGVQNWIEKRAKEASAVPHVAALLAQVEPLVEAQPFMRDLVQLLLVTMVYENSDRPGEDVGYLKSNRYSWCPCMSDVKRISLIAELVLDVALRFETNTPLTFTAFTSGPLLQEYLTIKALLYLGYSNITVHLIDVGYLDVGQEYQLAATALNKSLLDIYSELRELERKSKVDIDAEVQLRHKLHRAFIARTMQKILDKDLGLVTIDADLWDTASKEYAVVSLQRSFEKYPTISIHVHTNAFSYLSQMKRDKAKNNIMTVIDPDQGFFPAGNYPSESNALVITIDNAVVPQFYVFLPPYGEPLVYAELLSWSNPKNQKTYQAIMNILNQPGSPAARRNALIEKFSQGGSATVENYIDLHSLFQRLIVETALPNCVIYQAYKRAYANPAYVRTPAENYEKRNVAEITAQFIEGRFTTPQTQTVFYTYSPVNITTGKLKHSNPPLNPQLMQEVNDKNKTVLDLAVEDEDAAAVRLIFANMGETKNPALLAEPLFDAAFNGNVKIVRMLLEAGAKKDSKDADGKTALDFARENNHQEVVALLS